MPKRRSFTYRLCRDRPNISAAEARLLPVSSSADWMHIFSIMSMVSPTISFMGMRPTNRDSSATELAMPVVAGVSWARLRTTSLV